MLPAAPLPKFRVEANFPYTSTGIDYLGPLTVKNIFGPCEEMYKVHIALYTCASSRAVHLDLVTDLSCIAFVRSLKRFISRYGVSELYISDNATCFSGPELSSFVTQIGAKWKFILEASPWWGGFWERLVQSTKRSLRKTLGKSKLTYEELLTVIMEIEGVLNSRPLCHTYDDSIDEVITPSHLIFGRRLLSVFHDDQDPENIEFTTETITKRTKYLNELILHFRNSWTREYLTSLREFHKCNGKVPARQIALGEVVMIEADKYPRNRWKMGVVVEMYKSKDDFTRGCKVRTLTKGNRSIYLNRPINKLYPLEISSAKETIDINDLHIINKGHLGDPEECKDNHHKPSSNRQNTRKNCTSSDISLDNNTDTVTNGTKSDLNQKLISHDTNNSRPRRAAAQRGILKRKLCNQ